MGTKKIRYKLYVDKDFHTTYLINKKTGKLYGRKRVEGRGDSTGVLRVESPKKYEGQIMGRTIAIRGSSSRRGSIRRRI